MAQLMILGPDARAAKLRKSARYHRNISKRGRRTARVGLRHADYVNKKLEESGELWYGPEGPTDRREVNRWLKQGAREHTYTVKIVVSAEEGVRLSGAEWASVLAGNGQFDDYRMAAHHDTPNDHAHVLAFADRYMRRTDFTAWRRGVLERIKELEQRARIELEMGDEERRRRRRAQDAAQDIFG